MQAKAVSWIVLGLLLAAFPLFFWGGPDWVSPPLFCALWDSGHIVFFAVLMVYVQRFVTFADWREWLLLSLAGIALGSAIEFVQQFVGRDASALDVGRNLLGVWLGLFWGQAPSRRVWMMRLLTLVLVLPAVWPVTQAARLHWQARQDFPLLAGFEYAFEVRGAAKLAQLSEAFVTQGHYALKVNLNTDHYSGVGINNLLGDWRGYTTLAMDIYNPDAEVLPLVLRVSDLAHERGTHAYADRYNFNLLLPPGWSRLRFNLADIVRVPAGREMDLAAMGYVGLFAVQLPLPRSFYWDNVRLE